MVERKAEVITFRRSTVVRAGIVAAVLAAFGVGIAIGLALAQRSPSKATPAAALPTVLSCRPGPAPRVRPTRIDMGCTNGHMSMSSITWSHWGFNSGSGSGTLASNNCEPNCTTGRRTTTPAFVVVSNPVAGVFHNVLITPPGGRLTPQSSSKPGSGWGFG